ncbi:MAG: hypothetical protein IPJ77_21330 [Planctomycetes bacterium]|nr:hypothetical protein [Planctomycetota bacterium]
MSATLLRALACGVLASLLAPLSSAQIQSTMIGGNLLVWGGNAPNSVSITGTGGTLTVIGNGATTINGVPAVTFDGVTGALVVRLGGGDDALFLSQAQLPGGAFLSTAGGDDLVYVAQNQVQGHLVVDGGAASVAGDLLVLSDGNGVGNAVTGSLVVGASWATVVVRGSLIGQDLAVRTGFGTDQIKIDGCSVGGDLVVDSNGGDDLVDLGSLDLAVGNGIAGSLRVDAGSGNDDVRVGAVNGGSTTIGGTSAILLGYGADHLRIRQANFVGAALLRGGRGVDAAELQSPAYANVFGAGVDLGDFELQQ